MTDAPTPEPAAPKPRDAASPSPAPASPPEPPPAAPPPAPAGPWLEILRDRYRVHDRLLAVLVGITLAACCLLISTSRGTKAGHRPWPQDSVLRVIVELLNFNYEYPTPPRGHGVKILAQNLGGAAALIVAAGIWYVRTRRDDLDEPDASAPSLLRWGESSFVHVTAGGAAQLVLLVFGFWAVASAGWSPWPDTAFGEAIRHLILIVWAVAIGRTFTRAGARTATFVVVGVLTATSVLALWYYYVRNPELRLEFPIGNPLFYAACMLPGIILALAALAGIFEEARRPLPPAPPNGGGLEAADSVAKRVIAWIILCVALTTILWAFRLTGSRGPFLALLIGVAVAGVIALMRVVPAQRRRPVGLAVAAVALLVVAFVGWPWLRAQTTAVEGARDATWRLRQYTWKYAWRLFMDSPRTGHGQGGYVLLSQQMSRPDAERDPVCFPAEMVGHAHNEWLETLADLGAVGLVLMAMGLGLTIWLAVRAAQHIDDPKDRWCLLGLLACLIAIVVEECADVALRMPVLPLIFYTVIGLIWAMARDPGPGGLPTVHPLGKGIRVAGIAAAAIGGLAIGVVGARDWQSGLAYHRAIELAEQQKWDDALAAAQQAATHRLTFEERIYADMLRTNVAHSAAAYRLGQLRDTLARQQEQRAKTARRLGMSPEDVKEASPQVLILAQEDVLDFARFSAICINSGSEMWDRIPAIHAVAGLVSDTWYMRGEAEFIQQQLGLPHQEGEYLRHALTWLDREYQRNRLSAPMALEYLRMRLQAPAGQSMGELFDLLRIPMRGGPEPWGVQAEVESTLRLLMEHEDVFGRQMQVLFSSVGPALSQPNPNRWPDWYAPETLRLGAMASAISGEFGTAASMASEAVKLYQHPLLRRNFPTVLSHGRLDLARYLLWAVPNEPQRSIEQCRQAIEDWPPVGQREEQLQPLKQQLSLYLLAAGDEREAASVMRQVEGDLPDEQLQRNLGYGLWEVCGRFINFPPDGRPTSFMKWMNRALELAPDWPAGRMLAARVAFEQGRPGEGIEHLTRLESLLQDPRQAAPTLQGLLAQFPNSPELRAFVAKRFPELLEIAETHPASGPATAPAGATTTRPASTSTRPASTITGSRSTTWPE